MSIEDLLVVIYTPAIDCMARCLLGSESGTAVHSMYKYIKNPANLYREGIYKMGYKVGMRYIHEVNAAYSELFIKQVEQT